MLILAVFLVIFQPGAMQQAPEIGMPIPTESEGAEETAVVKEESAPLPETEEEQLPNTIEPAPESEQQTMEEKAAKQEEPKPIVEPEPLPPMAKKTVQGDFEGREGSIQLVSFPAGAMVYVDGRFVGTTSQTFRKIPAGTRHITLEKIGYKPYETDVFVPPDRIAIVEARLQKLY